MQQYRLAALTTPHLSYLRGSRRFAKGMDVLFLRPRVGSFQPAALARLPRQAERKRPDGHSRRGVLYSGMGNSWVLVRIVTKEEILFLALGCDRAWPLVCFVVFSRARSRVPRTAYLSPHAIFASELVPRFDPGLGPLARGGT